MKTFHLSVRRSDSLLCVRLVSSHSDYIIKEKTVLLQKKDSEGFGFVLRGAKGENKRRSTAVVHL